MDGRSLHRRFDPIFRQEIDDPEETQEDLGIPAGLGALLSPRLHCHWAMALAESWLFSRDYSRLLAALPFLILSVITVVFAIWLRHAPDTPTLAAYEQAIAEATERGDIQRQEAYLKGLVALRPGEPAYRFRLGKFLLENGREDGFAQLLEITAEGSEGYMPAHLWLVEQARLPGSPVRLPPEQMERHLLKIVQRFPDVAQARFWLAEIYARRQNWKLAEEYMATIVHTHPEYCILLAKIKRELQRSPTEVQNLLQKGAAEYARLLQQDPALIPLRIGLAEAQVLQGHLDDARLLLEAGLEQNDDKALRRALSELELGIVNRRLAESSLNADSCIPLVLKALETDPSNPRLVSELAKLHTLGLPFSVRTLKPVIQFWRDETEKSSQEAAPRILLGQLLSIAGDSNGTVEVLYPLKQSHPELRLPLASHLMSAGRILEAQPILEELLAEHRAVLQKSPDDHRTRGLMAETLVAAGRLDEARVCVLESSGTPSDSEGPVLALRSLYGRICLQLYDSLIPPQQPVSVSTQTSTRDAQRLLLLLRDAMATESTSLPAIDRLARLSLSKHPAAASAAVMVGQLRAQGDPGGKILHILGTQAILAGDYDKATAWLGQASQQTAGKDPGILNNLAISIVRSRKGDPEKALQFVNQALALQPGHPEILATRGEIYTALGRWTDAVTDLNQALPARSESLSVHRLLQQCYQALNDIQMASQHQEVMRRLQRSLQ